MRKVIALVTVILMMIIISACGGRQKSKMLVEPQVSQMKAICELAVMECYYHNVAKFKEENAEKILWWTKDKHFWIEYNGVVKVGIDISLVNIEVDDTIVTIEIPNAEVLECRIDETSLTKESFIVAKDSAKIEAEDETLAFEEAQKQMESEAASNKPLLAEAQQRAQSLLEEYIKNIGAVVGKQYTIKWVYLDESQDDGETGTADITE